LLLLDLDLLLRALEAGAVEIAAAPIGVLLLHLLAHFEMLPLAVVAVAARATAAVSVVLVLLVGLGMVVAVVVARTRDGRRSCDAGEKK
jgi:hypothetical protein